MLFALRRHDALTARDALTAALQAQVYSSTVGEHRTIRLDDGSTLALNSDTLVDVAFTPGLRSLTLHRGEAHFEVAHDTARPFLVTVNGRTVRAVGTAFNVRRRSDTDLDVLVTEGVVSTYAADERDAAAGAPADAERVSAGQLLRVRNGARSQIVRPGDAELEALTSWRRGVLVLDGITLEAALAEARSLLAEAARHRRPEPRRATPRRLLPDGRPRAPLPRAQGELRHRDPRGCRRHAAPDARDATGMTRRPLRAWPAAGLLASGLFLLLPAHAAPAEFDLDAGPATQTLGRFARQAGIALIFPYELAVDRTTQPVRGRYEPEQALQRLLQGSGLAFRKRDGELVIERERSRPTDARAPSPREPFANVEGTLATEEVVVTGSRLEPTGMSSVTPVTVLSDGDLRLFAPASLVDAIVQLPQFLNNDTPKTQSFGTSGAAGASHLNLRGIGSIRTLTLLDGRRVVPTTRFGNIDLALFPRSLAKRIEVVTGGASAAYGSDAVSGVANVMLDSRYDGMKAVGQAGITELGDNASQSFEFTWGSPLGDHSHLVVAAEAMHADGIRGYGSRPWFRSRAAIENPNAGGPREVTVDDVHATGYTYGGLILSGPFAGQQFLPGGVIAPFRAGAYATTTTQSGGDGEDPAAELVWILPNQSRASGFLKFTTEVTDAASAFIQVLSGTSRNEFGKDWPSLWGPWEATIYSDNAFLPANVRNTMRATNVDSFRFGRVAAEDLGRGMVENRSQLWSTTLGVDWQPADDWHVEGYYQYGRNRNSISYSDAVRIDRLYRALDSVVDPASGRTVCRSTLSFPTDGCVPLNLFGEGSPSQAATDYVTEGSTSLIQSIEQQVAELSVQGSPFDVPAGPVRIAGGLDVASRGERQLSTPLSRRPCGCDHPALGGTRLQGPAFRLSLESGAVRADGGSHRVRRLRGARGVRRGRRAVDARRWRARWPHRARRAALRALRRQRHHCRVEDRPRMAATARPAFPRESIARRTRGQPRGALRHQQLRRHDPRSRARRRASLRRRGRAREQPDGGTGERRHQHARSRLAAAVGAATRDQRRLLRDPHLRTRSRRWDPRSSSTSAPRAMRRCAR